MNFETIRSKVGKYETKADASVVATQLQSLIAKKGFDVFKNIELLTEEIKSLKLSPTTKAQLSLVFSCSTLPDFILNSKSDLNMVDVDNAVHSVVSSTELSYKCAIALIADVFYACGLSFAIENGPQLVNGSIEYKLHALMPSVMAEAETKKAIELHKAYESAYGEKKDKLPEAAGIAAEKAVEVIKSLCVAGISEGFYLLGRCYLYGECGTDIDRTKAMELMKTAAEQGNTRAAVLLGDLFYQSDDPLVRDYTLAHHYYTRPGTLAMGKKQQTSLQDIYKQYSANKTTLVFSGVILALMITFMVFFHTGIFTGSSRLAIGIILIVISIAAYALAIINNRNKRFNGIRWFVAVQYFVWALYAFILVLA
ncbi:hypothetical protein Hs30E_10530 [Lactococcus hodotermopsidis]|uniref:Sel1 repeat family protein n=1 Tax=Pseudolactococcus hodotermopsidis TaxID=2709157 RepID=A0A6A0BAU0_9LACT|nr:SEL1-like repeat protein [Lactococcus hodotermopsidis]GFH42502.1 hypothetical protein Hs30E_10530 [Lactococcus hodotermopsidis]